MNADVLPLVSVVMPVYNAAPYLETAVRSVFAQTHGNLELIAVDDGSSDTSLAILRKLATEDTRLRIVSRKNTGIVGALNDGIAIAKGPYLARMDADDISHPRRFERQLELFQSQPGLVAVGSAFYYTDSTGAFICRTPRPLAHEEIEQNLLLGDGGALIHPAVMFRLDAVKAVGAYRQDAIWIEDLDLYLRLAMIGRLANLPEALFWYRLHLGSVNFTRNEGRFKRKLEVLRQAWSARGRSFDESLISSQTHVSSVPPSRCLEFSISSLAFGRRGRPLHWLWEAFRRAPTQKQTLSTLSYVIRAKLGLIKVRQIEPETAL